MKSTTEKKTTVAMLAATALAALGVGLAAPAMASPGLGPVPATSVATQHGGAPLDCSVHVLYQGADVDVNWC
jgi:hypothetical protein